LKMKKAPSPQSTNPDNQQPLSSKTESGKPKRRKVVALRYRSGEDSAPVVIAKGAGAIAESILAIAEKHDIPLYKDPDLVEVLSSLDMGDHIPPELYEAVVKVLLFVHNINKKYEDFTKKDR
jgi:flagellar biosynthesis protein